MTRQYQIGCYYHYVWFETIAEHYEELDISLDDRNAR